MQRPEIWPSPSEVEAVKIRGGACAKVAECYEFLKSCFDTQYPKVVRCPRCGGCVEGGHERDGSDLCWCSHSEPEPEVQSEA